MQIKTSIRTRLALLGTLSIIVVALIVVSISVFYFRQEIETLYADDFASRIDSIEFEYADVDAVSGASDQSAELQNALLDRLARRFAGQDEAFPFIITGSGKIVQWPSAFGIDANYAITLAGLAKEGGALPATLETNAGAFWFIADYYEPWDWFTGYAVKESVRTETLRAFLKVVILASAVIGGAALALYLIVLGRALRPLRAVQGAVQGYSGGDLRARVPIRRHDEVGTIAAGVNEFADRLGQIVGSIKESSTQSLRFEERLRDSSAVATSMMGDTREAASTITTRADELADLTKRSNGSAERIGAEVGKLNGRIEDQFAAVTEATASMEQMNGALNSVAAITQSKRSSSERLIRSARDGADRLGQTTAAIENLVTRVDAISDFIAIIQNVASQTNLLAMNAAIEAAHAGEAGRGFAVVADEIRKLAEEAASNSNSTTKSISDILAVVRQAAASGSETQHVFDEIEQEIQTVVNSLDEIAASAAELSAGSGEVMTAMQMLQQISVEVKSGSEAVREEADAISSAMLTLANVSAAVHEATAQIAEQTGRASSAISSVAEVTTGLHDAMGTLGAQVELFRVE